MSSDDTILSSTMASDERNVSTAKRERCRNFLEVEKEELIELVTSYKNIVENKKTDAITSKQKDHAWKCITQKFNAIAKTGNRSPQQLKLLYTSMKKKAKKTKADEKVERYKTGGGASKKVQCTPYEERIVDLLGPAATSHENPYDCNENEQNAEVNLPEILPSDEDIIVEDPVIQTSEITEREQRATSSNANEKVANFFSKVKTILRNKRNRCEELSDEHIKLKRERHDKKMEILEIIKKKELIDLQMKEMELAEKLLLKQN